MDFRLNTTKQGGLFPVEECVNTIGENYSYILESEAPFKNISCLDHAPALNKSELTKASVLSILTVLSFIGNSSTMYSIHKSRKCHKGHIYNLLYNLAIADLCVTFWCMMGDSIWYFTVEWKLGNLECKLFKFAQMFSLYLSTFIMVLIGVDRFIAVKYPMKSMSKGICFKLTVFCWILSGILSLPQVIVFHVQLGPFQEPFYQCVTYGSYSYDWQEQLYTIFTVIFTFILPLSILATTYVLTVCTLHRNEGILVDNSWTIRAFINPNRTKLIRRAKMKSLRISVAIVLGFIICWTPYYTSMIYTFLTRKNGQDIEDPDNLLFTLIFFFGVSNSLCNPIIYAVFHLWKPRRKELQRDSTRRSLFSSLNLYRRRSTILINENGTANVVHKVSNCVNQTNDRSRSNNINLGKLNSKLILK